MTPPMDIVEQVMKGLTSEEVKMLGKLSDVPQAAFMLDYDHNGLRASWQLIRLRTKGLAESVPGWAQVNHWRRTALGRDALARLTASAPEQIAENANCSNPRLAEDLLYAAHKPFEDMDRSGIAGEG